MKHILVTSIIFIFGASLLSSCSQQTPPPVKKTTPRPQCIGTVDRVFPQYKYVLIHVVQGSYPAGTVLISQAPDNQNNTRTANLIVTPERCGKLRIPADIRSGSVMEGDLVYIYRNLAEPDAVGEIDQTEPSPKPATAPENDLPPIKEGEKEQDTKKEPVPDKPNPTSPLNDHQSDDYKKAVDRELDSIPKSMDDM